MPAVTSSQDVDNLNVDQQGQTLNYFRNKATDWQRKAVNAVDEYNLIESRNAAVLATIDAEPRYRSLLDVGCGTGQLVIDATKRGLDATGIDFAQQMIEQCETNQKDAGVKATFHCASAFEFKAPNASYDVVSAQGFIEYISMDELRQFIYLASNWLKPGGALLLGSRNRLYNLVSINAFTEIERELGTLSDLAREAIILQESVSQDAVIGTLKRLLRSYPEPISHPDTGIGVSLRLQFSPAEMIDKLERAGLRVKTIYPVHYHALPPALKSEYPALHHEIAKTMQRLAQTDHRIVPYCSTFVIDARLGP